MTRHVRRLICFIEILILIIINAIPQFSVIRLVDSIHIRTFNFDIADSDLLYILLRKGVITTYFALPLIVSLKLTLVFLVFLFSGTRP